MASSAQASVLGVVREENRTIVRVYPSTDELGLVFKEALAERARVRFTSCADVRECGAGDAIIVFSGDQKIKDLLLQAGVRAFHFPAGAAGRSRTGEGQSIQFGGSGHLDARLRGRMLSHQALLDGIELQVGTGDEVLASYAGRPAWILRKRHDGQAHLVFVPLPRLERSEMPGQHLTGEKFLPVLPLIHFLREVTGESTWEKPPLMASLIVDDPNLHWSSYGFLVFENMLAHIKAAGAHSAFATIPLDAWRYHSRTVSLFRDHQRYFSLLYHGNDHTKQELAYERTREAWLAVFAQGMTRIDRMEKNTGLQIARVMVPPHEGCSEAALLALSDLGFEGACISMGSLYRWSTPRRAYGAFGMELAEWMCGQLPVMHRFNLAPRFFQGHIVIAAFLNRPIIPVVHHDSFADGYEVLDRALATINSLGEVCWGGPSMILNRSYFSVRENHHLLVKPYSRRVQLVVPEGVTQASAVLSEDIDANLNLDVAVRDAQGHQVCRRALPPGESVAVRSGQTLEIRLVSPDAVDFRQVKQPGLSYRALFRRLLCEGRDRLSPILSKTGVHKSK